MFTRVVSNKMPDMSTAVKPWNSVDALARVKVTIVDSQKDIECCLNCEFPSCWNCMAEKRARF